MGKIFRGEWDCNKCGKENISIVHDRCPSCGSVRDADVTYHEPRSMQKEYVTGQEEINAKSGEDWKCSYCDRLNHAWNEKCECGASKNESDANYFELKEKQKQKEQEIRERELSDERERQQAELDNNPLKTVKDVRGHAGTHQNWINLGAILFAVAFIGSLIGLLIPKSVTLDIDRVTWKYTINIDEEREFYENDWDLPSGARLDHTQEEIRSYKDVPDGTKEVIKYRTKTVDDGYTTITKDLGNGYFSEEKIPKTKTVQESYIATETKYKQVPVKDTKYYYYIDRYVYNRSVVTEGIDRNPYFGELNLSNKERESGREELYTVTGKVKNKDVTYTISKEDWSKLDEGMTVDGKVSMGYFTLIKEK